MSKVIKELRKLAWIESVAPGIGGFAPNAERAVRMGLRMTIQDLASQQPVIASHKAKSGKDGKK